MFRNLRTTIVILTILVVVLALPAWAQEKKTGPTEFICPMYCTDEVATSPGQCSVCGMALEDRHAVEHPEGYEVISPEKASSLLKKSGADVIIIDVRTKKEFEGTTGHLEGALLFPEREIKNRMSELESYKGKTLLIYCSHGIRSGRAAKMLNEVGFTALSLMGGTTKWKRDGYPLVQEKQSEW